MSTTKPRRSKRRKIQAPVVGKDAYVILDAGRNQIQTPQPAAVLALVRAQAAAERQTEPVSYEIVRQSLFGPEAIIYRVVRDDLGVVFTYTVNPED